MVEAAPARARIRVLAVALMLVFLGLAGRAVQLAAFSGVHADKGEGAASAPAIVRADLTDRNGVLLATTVPAFQLVAHPKKVWDAPNVARQVVKVFPDLDRAEVQRRLEEREKDVVFLRRDLTPRQREAIFALGLPGIDFRDQQRRVYPQGSLAAHLLGVTNAKREGAAGLERGLDPQIRRSGAAGDPIRLSLDVRVQHALETELDAAIAAARAHGGAGLVVNARTGEILAMTSAPRFDLNAPPSLKDERWLNRAAGAVYEMGSTLKPFTIAAALDAKLTSPNEIFDLTKPIALQGYVIDDDEPLGPRTPLPEALAKSSNIMAATLALRLGAPRQKAMMTRLGLYDRAAIDLPESARPLAPQDDTPLTVAVLGYGHGMAMSLAALAEAYTVFANKGARAPLTMLAKSRGDEIDKIQVFTPATTAAVLAMMRGVVTEGTATRADIAGLDIAGKTGTAEKPDNGVYIHDRMLSSFAAVFPAYDPHYVILVALDEPARTPASGNLATGGAVAAPAAGRIAARIAPLLGVLPAKIGGGGP
jgi:cell division protein FtsI (penicillin-binding protein 3)